MSDKKYKKQKKHDITIFGATGLTGKQIVRHVYELSVNKPEFYSSEFSWAIAGRSEEKLQEIIDEMSKRYSKAKISNPSIIIVNLTAAVQVEEMVCQTKVLINAVGPFRFMGEYVVRACIDNGCDYVDITGEPEFVERMQRTYHDEAVSKNVTIVHSCGFDSVPTDMGVLYTKSLYTEKNWTPTQIEMFFRFHSGPAGVRGGYATYESAVHGFGSSEALKETRKMSKLPKLPIIYGPKLTLKKGICTDGEFGYCTPFVFADPSIVRLSQQLFLVDSAKTKEQKPGVTKPPTVQFAAYSLLPSIWAIALYTVYGFIFSYLAGSPWGRNLLLRHPELFSAGIFSKQHPTQEQLDQSSFEIILRSEGYDRDLTSVTATAKENGPPNKTIKVVCRGPEPGYVATPRIVLQCAMAINNNKEKGFVPNGVLTPSTAFWQTDLIDRLRRVGITYDISL